MRVQPAQRDRMGAALALDKGPHALHLLSERASARQRAANESLADGQQPAALFSTRAMVKSRREELDILSRSAAAQEVQDVECRPRLPPGLFSSANVPRNTHGTDFASLYKACGSRQDLRHDREIGDIASSVAPNSFKTPVKVLPPSRTALQVLESNQLNLSNKPSVLTSRASTTNTSASKSHTYASVSRDHASMCSFDAASLNGSESLYRTKSICSDSNDDEDDFVRFRRSGSHTSTSRGSEASLKEIKERQRGSNNLYKSSYFFRTGLSDIAVFERSSLICASEYMCNGNYGCASGNCASQLQSIDIQKCRSDARLYIAHTKMSQSQFLTDRLLHVYDGEFRTFKKLRVHLDAVTTVELCVASWALVHGFSSSLLQTVTNKIMVGEVQTQENHLLFKSGIGFDEQKERRSTDFVQLRVQHLLKPR